MLTTPTVHHKGSMVQRWLAHHDVHGSCDLPQSPGCTACTAYTSRSHEVRRRGLGTHCDLRATSLTIDPPSRLRRTKVSPTAPACGATLARGKHPPAMHNGRYATA
eukprot:6098456-Prymnesium_polylepis.1